MFRKSSLRHVGLDLLLFAGIFLIPAERYAMAMPWQGIVPVHSSRSDQAESTPIFEQYGLISADQENAILDNFAIQLLNDSNLTGKVILRRGQYSKKFAAKKLLLIKKYLYQHRHVPANRVSAFELRSGRDYTVELYLVSKAKRGSGPL